MFTHNSYFLRIAGDHVLLASMLNIHFKVFSLSLEPY